MSVSVNQGWQTNPDGNMQVVNGLTFNGGMFGIMIGFTRLYQHSQAVQRLVCALPLGFQRRAVQCRHL